MLPPDLEDDYCGDPDGPNHHFTSAGFEQFRRVGISRIEAILQIGRSADLLTRANGAGSLRDQWFFWPNIRLIEPIQQSA